MHISNLLVVTGSAQVKPVRPTSFLLTPNSLQMSLLESLSMFVRGWSRSRAATAQQRQPFRLKGPRLTAGRRNVQHVDGLRTARDVPGFEQPREKAVQSSIDLNDSGCHPRFVLENAHREQRTLHFDEGNNFD